MGISKGEFVNRTVPVGYLLPNRREQKNVKEYDNVALLTEFSG